MTAFQPTLTTAPEAEFDGRARRDPGTCRSAGVIGAHLEGPFLSPMRLGAHPRFGRPRPRPGLLERLLAAGPVTEMTLAPELAGALELIDLLLARGVVVSCGHSDATAEEALARVRPWGRGRGRTSSTRCARSGTATRGSRARRWRATTSSCR